MSSTRGVYRPNGTGRWSGYAERENGDQVPLSWIDGVTVWMRDPGSGVDIRGTQAVPQDVWASGAGDHGFQFQETTDDDGNPVTELGWDLSGSDLVYQSDVVMREDHVARITVSYAAGGPGGTAKTIIHEHIARLLDPRRLPCTLDHVEEFLMDEIPEGEESKVEAIILRVAVAAERYCRRGLLRSTSTNPTVEVQRTRPGETILWVSRWPIVDGTMVVEESFDAGQDDAWSVIDPAGYVVGEDGSVERILGNTWGFTPYVRLTFEGGLYSDQAEAPDDLAAAIAEQAAYLYKRRGKTEVAARSVQGQSSSTRLPKRDRNTGDSGFWVPGAQQILDSAYRRPEL